MAASSADWTKGEFLCGAAARGDGFKLRLETGEALRRERVRLVRYGQVKQMREDAAQ